MTAPTIPTRVAAARRHASRVANSGALTYHAAPTTAASVHLLGLRPAGASGRDHNAATCACPVVSIESATTWNADCPPAPPAGQPRAWGVLER
jgi:hypothetical protein